MRLSSIERHKSQYDHNIGFLSTINENEYSDWYITICFYCSLHKVNQCMHYSYDASDDELSSHGSTHTFIRSHNTNLFFKYKRLFDLSHQSRYECLDLSGRTVEAKDLLVKIENASKAIMAQTALSKANQ